MSRRHHITMCSVIINDPVLEYHVGPFINVNRKSVAKPYQISLLMRNFRKSQENSVCIDHGTCIICLRKGNGLAMMKTSLIKGEQSLDFSNFDFEMFFSLKGVRLLLHLMKSTNFQTGTGKSIDDGLETFLLRPRVSPNIKFPTCSSEFTLQLLSKLINPIRSETRSPVENNSTKMHGSTKDCND